MGRRKIKTEEELKAAHREANRLWYQKNKNKILVKKTEWRKNNPEYWAEYYQNNKEKIAAQRAEWYQYNKEKILERRAEYRQNNKEKIAKRQAEYGAKYRKNNKEKRAACWTEWYQNNKGKVAAYYQANKEKIAEKGAAYRKTPKGRAETLIKNYKQEDKKQNRDECTLTAEWIVEHIFNEPCHYCGRTDWHELGCDRIDNSLPHTPENCVPCCWECNRKKGITPYDEYMKMIGAGAN